MSFLYLVDQTNSAKISRFLNKGNNPNIQDKHGRTLLHLTAYIQPRDPKGCEKLLQIARVLIHFGANVDQTDESEFTPLHFAIIAQNYEMIEFLVEAKAQMDLKDRFGNTGLHYAVHNCFVMDRGFSEIQPWSCPGDNSCSNWKIVKHFLKYHPNINATNNMEETPLMWAVKRGNFRIVQELSKGGTSQNRKDTNGNTALHIAFDQPEVNFDIVAELMRYGSQPSLRNNNFHNPLDLYLKRRPENTKKARLLEVSIAERKNMHLILKVFLLKRFHIQEENLKTIYRPYIFACLNEIDFMERDKITSHCSVYDLISWNYGENKQVSSNLCDRLFSILLTGKYKIYSDVIISYLPRMYLNHRFAEICCWEERNNERKQFLTYDLRVYLFSHFLSPFHVYNMMLAITK